MNLKQTVISMVWAGVLGGAFHSLQAQQTGYTQTNLVANVPGVASNTDPQLSNPWGISFVPGDPFWIANNNSGTSTLYDALGNKQSLVVTLPSATVNPCNPGCPTGTVANTTTNFTGALFLFDTEDGIVAKWNGAGNATVAVDNSSSGAVYKGLALLSASAGNFLLAANFNSGKIDVFDSNIHATSLSGSFLDPNLPAGYAPHGIHIIKSNIYVTYALQDSAKHDPTVGAGNGAVDVFDLNGNFVKRLATGGVLNAPWGVAMAPASFGTFANDLLVGNFGDGTINAFDPSTGQSLGQLKDSGGKPITNPGLWELVFGAGGTGDSGTLYFTAGGSDQTQGLFAALAPSAAATGPGFSLSLSQQSATVAPGGSVELSVNATGTSGFSSPVTLACTASAGITCELSPTSVTPGAGTATSTLTVTAAATAPPMGYHQIRGAALLPFSFGILGWLLAARRRSFPAGPTLMGLVVFSLLVLAACGGGGTHMSPTLPTGAGNPSVTVTGTAGSQVHSVMIPLTVQ